MEEISDLGLELFGDEGKFKLWMNTPNLALGNITPIELLKNSTGEEAVIGELTRIGDGIFV